jgi:peptidyl-prolyl cis-trans isomerase D
MNRFAPLALAAAVFLSGCDSLKEAMTAHVDVVATAGSQELSVARLAEMMGNTPQVPINKETAKVIANTWANYQLLGHAAAQGDSLNDPEKIDEAMWMQIAQVKSQKLSEEYSKKAAGDTNITEAIYAQGNILAAQHILLRVPEGASPAAADSIRKKAESIRAQATAANFAALAAKHSEDPGSKDRGGMYPAFPRAPRQGAMVPEFEQGVMALQPGQIGPLVRTMHGYHIIRRPTLAEVRQPYGQFYAQFQAQDAMMKIVDSGNVSIKPKAAETVRAVAQDLDAHRDDRTVVASSSAGNLTAGRVADYIRAIPLQEQAGLRASIAQAPDTVLTEQFVKQLLQLDLMVKAADDAKLGPDSTELNQMRSGFAQMVQAIEMQLGVAPAMLADSAKTESERERLAGARIERYMDGLLSGQAQYVMIPEPLERVLRETYDAKVTEAGIDRAVERAQVIRAMNDSTRAAQPRPPSAVPVPGQAPPGNAPPAAPPGSPPPAGR